MNFAWLPLAILSYILQAVNGAVDRAIVHKEVTKPIVISFWVAIFSVATAGLLLIGLLPIPGAETFQFETPSGLIFGLAILAGVLSQAGLLYMFRALEYGEATRVLSSMGALTPIITLVGAYFFLDERFSSLTLLAFVLLIMATIVLTIQPNKADTSTHSKWILNALLASLLLAVQSLIMKYVFDNYHFISGFALTGVGAGVYVAIIATLSQNVRKEIAGIFNKSSSKETEQRTSKQVWWIIGNSAIGGVAVIILNLAIKLGSPVLVNALRGVQYAGIFIIAFLLAKKYPGLLDEDLSKESLFLKSIGIILIINGVVLLAIAS